MEIPAVKLSLEIEGIKMAILKAFDNYSFDVNEMVNISVKEHCNSEAFANMIDETVKRVLKEQIEEQFRRCFNYGDGYTFINDIVLSRISTFLTYLKEDGEEGV